MLSSKLGYSLACVFAMLAFGIGLNRIRMRTRGAQFDPRPKLTTRDLWEMYYSHRGYSLGEFTEAWVKICKLAKLDCTKLRPSDTLGSLIAARPWWYRADDETTDVLEYVGEIANENHIALEIKSVRAIDELVVALMKSNQSSRGGIAGQEQ